MDNIVSRRVTETPASQTGGEGTHYENWAQAYFLILMILEEDIPFLGAGYKIYRLDFQSKTRETLTGITEKGFEIDDIIVYANKGDEKSKLLVTIKKNIDLTGNVFNEMIKRAFRDMQRDDFSIENDLVILATRIIDSNKAWIPKILQLAKSTNSYERTFMSGARDSNERANLNKIENALRAEKQDITNNEILSFLKSFDILTMDIRRYDRKAGYSGWLTTFLSLIKKYMENSQDDPLEIWDKAYNIASRISENAEIIEKDDYLPEIIEMKNRYLIDQSSTRNGDSKSELVSTLLGTINSANSGDLEEFTKLRGILND